MNLEKLFESTKDAIDKHDGKNIKYLYDILKKYDNKDWYKYVNINEDTYTKTFVNGNEDFDIYIITWNKYQESKIHDNSENGCIFRVLKGHLIEEAFNDKLEIIGIRSLYKNNIGYVDDYFKLHKMINTKNNCAVSLHIYYPTKY